MQRINPKKTKTMSFGEAIKACFEKYAVFSGRSRRSEYWYFYLFTFLVSLVLECIPFLGLLSFVWFLAQLIPSLAVTVRRFHDIGKSGWNYLFFAIPELLFFGYIFSIMFYAIKDLIDAGIDLNNWADNTEAIGKIIGNSIVTNGSLVTFCIYSFILVVSIILWLVWMTRDSQPGENQWGPNPKEVPSNNNSGMN